MVIPEHQSIFGDTVHGVPSPLVPHTHPYPTRFHGPVNTTPRFGLPYRQQSLVVPRQFTVQAMGAVEPLTGGAVTDAIVGGVLGYLAAPQGSTTAAGKSRLLWSVGGSLAGLIGGGLGLGFVAGMVIHKKLVGG
jgi:hypothetical protein